MKKFDHDLEVLQEQLNEMGNLTLSMVSLASAAVKDRRDNDRDQITESERRLDQMQMDIDQDAVRMLTVYGPVAGQLRYLLVCTHVTSQLERIGDQAVNICESVDMMTTDPATHPTLPKLHQMADLVAEMVRDALDAYFDKDADKAQQTRTHDDAVNALNDQIIRELLTDEVLREVLAGAQDIADAVAQILISRNMERMADQATNICKEVIYMVRGDDVRHIHAPGQPPS